MTISLALSALLQLAVAGPARPAECAPLESTTAANVWERAKSPALRRYCDLLASGAAKLAGPRVDESHEALAIADEAARTIPEAAAPLVLRGRALVRLARWREALEALEAAHGRDPQALEDPAALLAWGRALGRSGRLDDADAAYRALLPRAASLPVADRAAAGIEAALLFESRGPSGVAEATAVLRQARRDAQDAMQSLAVVALALSLDRAGERDEARAVLGSAPKIDGRALLADPRVQDALADAASVSEADALTAIALETRDPAAAREAWTSYLAGPAGKGPWAEHARGHISNAPRARRPR